VRDSAFSGGDVVLCRCLVLVTNRRIIVKPVSGLEIVKISLYVLNI
jgi:hypothetical protein